MVIFGCHTLFQVSDISIVFITMMTGGGAGVMQLGRVLASWQSGCFCPYFAPFPTKASNIDEQKSFCVGLGNQVLLS